MAVENLTVKVTKSDSRFRSTARPLVSAVIRSVLNAVLTLLVIIFLTLFGLEMASRGRAKIPAPPLQVAAETVSQTVDYLFNHPTTYTWSSQQLPAFDLVYSTLKNSAGLLLAALMLAVILGISLGLAAARVKGKAGSALVVTLSVLGMSTPTFFLGMLLWIVNIQLIHNTLGFKGIPSAGFGWDTHLIMPAIVLAMRPMAQIAQVTYVSLRDVMGQDYIRTAYAKGMGARLVNSRHALRNILIPVLTTVGTSLRFSLASLPVVETFFDWPGVGITLLAAIQLGSTAFTADLIVCLGLFFLVFNLFLDVLFPFIDARLRKDGSGMEKVENPGWRDIWIGIRTMITSLWLDALRLLRIRKPDRIEQPRLLSRLQEQRGEEPVLRKKPWSGNLHLAFRNPAFVIGSLLILGLAWLAIFGSSLSPANPFEIHGVEKVDGVISSPPFKPSVSYPWGTDHIGRDIQAFVLAGARRTLVLALFAMLARVALGTVLGMLAGWWQDSWFDRLVGRLMNIWAAFPVTIFAMLLIQALGIQQGMWVFIVALCVVGWGEVTQFVRAQTIRIKPQLYIEAARSMGARPSHLLAQQVFPNLISSITVVAALEMGGVLLLLAELGYLNIFLGGGFSMELFVDRTVHFSDVPEWGAMLANIRQWWRSYPWMAWYPGIAFFLAIIAFNLFGEGLRHFLEETRINLSRILNRYTLLGAVAIVSLAAFTLQEATPLNLYRSQAREFNTNNVLRDIAVLSNPAFEGRMPTTPGYFKSAEYISQRMYEAGLYPTNLENNSFVRNIDSSFMVISEKPALNLYEAGGQKTALELGRDFSEWYEQYVNPWYGTPGGDKGEVIGQVVGVAIGPLSTLPGARAGLFREIDIYDQIVITFADNLALLPQGTVSGVLIVADSSDAIQERYMIDQGPFNIPMLRITPETADRLLQTAGSSLAELTDQEHQLLNDQVFTTAPGSEVGLSTKIDNLTTPFASVIGILPGTGAQQESDQRGVKMDRQAIVVAAYFDGLGISQDGKLYPGANDNASGVATMLEIARLLKEGPYAPKKTIIFVAWTGGEEYKQLSITQLITNNGQLDDFIIEGVIELTGLGAGSGRGIAIGENSSYRMLSLFQEAASKIGVSTTTRGRHPHINLPTEFNANPRTSPSLYLSWDGSDEGVHLPTDDYHSIDAEKIRKSGQSISLMISVMSREPNW